MMKNLTTNNKTYTSPTTTTIHIEPTEPLAFSMHNEKSELPAMGKRLDFNLSFEDFYANSEWITTDSVAR